MKEIVLDTETTGLSVENGHRIVEIGCIELDDQILTSNRFHCYLNPQRKVSEEAFKVHGYSDEFLSDKKKFHEIADDFIEFIGDKFYKDRLLRNIIVSEENRFWKFITNRKFINPDNIEELYKAIKESIENENYKKISTLNREKIYSSYLREKCVSDLFNFIESN